ncbi:hypothetical protein GBA65_18150 [Rubrobacter marinus]|uniref:Uncharacterized protein n=1 Tax=Rubrobacter marinus TaxID=2653852 RepID=A0A6G8Q0Y1_9ACTN|nr:hypothetical protein [Rubrobacter marinus]QIN80123.1 hypothetical protein GBA65_18150 [Rubrobacter marinus]
MTHNLTSGLLLPAAAAFVLLVEPRKVLDWRIVPKGVGVFLISLVPYAYLPLRARMDPPSKVREPSDWEWGPRPRHPPVRACFRGRV